MNYNELKREAKRIDCVSFMEYQSKTGAALFQFCPGIPSHINYHKPQITDLDSLEQTKLQIDEKYKDIEILLNE